MLVEAGAVVEVGPVVAGVVDEDEGDDGVLLVPAAAVDVGVEAGADDEVEPVPLLDPDPQPTADTSSRPATARPHDGRKRDGVPMAAKSGRPRGSSVVFGPGEGSPSPRGHHPRAGKWHHQTIVSPPEPPSSDLDATNADDAAEAAAYDQQLLVAAQRGEDRAFAELIERYDPLMATLAAGLLDGHDTDVLLTESYIRAYRSLARQAGDPVPWLLRTTYLTCLAEARRRERRRIGGPGRLPDRRPSADQAPLAGIAPDERAVLVLVDGAGVEDDLVSQALEVPPATVQTLLERARAQLGDRPALALGAAGDHDPAFWAVLGSRLLEEREAPAAPVPELPEAGRPAPAERLAKAPPVAMQRRAPRAAREARREPDSVDRLAVGARKRRTRTPLPVLARRFAAVLAVLAVIGGAGAAVIHYGARAKSPVRTNSVADVASRVIQALDVDSLSTTFTRTVGGRSSSYLLVRNRAGSYLLVDTKTGRSAAFDASRDDLRSRDGGGGSEATGVAAGPPDPSPWNADLPDAELDLALRTLRTATDEKAVPTKVGKTEAWQLEGTLEGDAATDADHVELVVDRDRLAPLSVTFTRGSRPVRSVHFLTMALDGPAPGPFTVDLTGVVVVKTDAAFQATTVDGVAAQVGYQPLRPTFLPSGFELAGTTVRIEGKVVALRYQRGFQQIVVTTRTSPVAKGQRWPDPFPGAGKPARPVAIKAGPYRDTTAQRRAGLGSMPALWGTDGRLAFTVAGDLTDAQLTQVAESLR